VSLLATPEEFAAIRGVTYDPTDQAVVLALEGASDLVRSVTEQRLDHIADDEVTLDGTGTSSLLLPELPVTEVSEIVVLDDAGNEEALTTADWRLRADAGILWRIGVGATWTRGRENIRVTYSHGYLLPGESTTDDPAPAALPADIELVVCQLAWRIHSLVAGRTVNAESIGSYSVTYADEAGNQVATVGLTDLERAVLGRHRHTRLA
jgi:hypothetical protein